MGLIFYAKIVKMNHERNVTFMNILKVVFVIIGTLIGAGFASGQEIYTFFFSYGIKGILGIIISSTIIGLTIYKTFKIIEKNNIKNYKEFLDFFKKKKKIKELINSIINIFILVSFYVMIAGFGAYLEQEINLNNFIGSSILAILCIILFKTNINVIIIVRIIGLGQNLLFTLTFFVIINKLKE